MPRKKVASKARFPLNTAAEEARIQKGIKADPDNPELTPDQLSRMRPFRELQAERRRGRPRSESPKELLSMRFDAEVVKYFRSSGPGWQTRMNEALAAYMRREQRRAR